jgi:hypothetical protein
MSNYDSFGYALAMRVMQSDLYPELDERERSECDELIHRGNGQAGVRINCEVVDCLDRATHFYHDPDAVHAFCETHRRPEEGL